jgi:type IV secretory pathway VirD2 relaxase
MDDNFVPKLGKPRSRGNASARRYLNRVKQAVENAKPGRNSAFAKRPRFSGVRIGRGVAAGHMLAARSHPFAKFRARRVVVKVNIARMKGQGVGAAKAHVNYIQRDGVNRDGSPGRLYDATSDDADGKAFMERSENDRHQFRLIVSPEDADELGELKAFTREFMKRAEHDLATKLDWIAVDHFNTDNPHIHIVIRGREPGGKDLVIARDYITQGFRRRASEIAEEELGPRADREIARMQQREVEKERFTSIDRDLLSLADENGAVSITTGRGPYGRFRRSLILGRLQKLTKLGLAKEGTGGNWHLSSELEPSLRRLGERGDIIRTMQRAVGVEKSTSGFAIFDPADRSQKPIIGRVVAHGGSDELRNARYLIIDASDGRQWYVDAGVMEPGSVPPVGAIVEAKIQRAAVKPADRTIAEIAAKSAGQYSDDLHAAYDPNASAEYRTAHKRRLEALRRDGIVTRRPDGTWLVPDDYLERAGKFEARRRRGARLRVLSWLPLEKLAERQAATWLDRSDATAIADIAEATGSGFAEDVRKAQERRRRWLLAQGIVLNVDHVSQGQLARMRQSELNDAAKAIARRTGKAPVSAGEGSRIEGIFTRTVDLGSGRYAVVERSKEFSLVPWRPTLERRRGASVAGIVRGGNISWSAGRKRGLGIG